MDRLGLGVVAVGKKITSATTSLELPEGLPSVKDTLKTLAAALNALETPGLIRAMFCVCGVLLLVLRCTRSF
jgi:hypothetical protein